MAIADSGTEIKLERAKELRNHLGHLDALRGIAVLGVILIHSAQWCPSMLESWFMGGQRGVQLFFIVSAFTLFLSTDGRRGKPQSWTGFFLRRFFRLAPMYYPCIVLARMLFPPLRFNAFDTTLAFLFLHNLTIRSYWAGTFGGWSLGNEALFYLCFPLLFHFISTLRRALTWFLVATPLSIILAQTMMHLRPQFPDFWQFFWFPTELPVFLMGVVTYFIWKEWLRDMTETRFAKPLSVLLLFVTGALVASWFPLDENKLVLSSAAGAVLLVAVSLYQWKFLVNRFTIFLGKISYSVYLVQGFLLWVGYPWVSQHYAWAAPSPHHQLVRVGVVFTAVLLSSTAISTLTWLLIEEPGIRLGRLVIQRLEGRKTNRHATDLLVPLKAVTGVGNSPDAQF